MKTLINLLFLFSSLLLNAQGIINNGAKIIVNSNNYLKINGAAGNYKNQYAYSNNGRIITNGTLSLQGNWINNTSVPLNLLSTNGTIVFNGSTLQSINGASSTYFKNISIDNSSGIFLNSNISVSNNLKMLKGNFDLRNYVINLGTTGNILNEYENSRIKASDGKYEGAGTGSVIIIKNITSGAYTNFAGLGIDIISNFDLGNVTIERKHTVTNYKGVQSISRSFNFITNNDNSINATIRMYYFDNEINGQNEKEFVFWNSQDGGENWVVENPTTIDIKNNYIEKTGITSLTRFTIGAPFAEGFLPIDLISFEGKCDNNVIAIKWATASESNNDFFTVERSADAINYTPIAIVKGGGNSNTTLKYEIFDKNPLSTENFYRLKQTDFDGNYKYFAVKSFDCIETTEPEIILSCYPNPFNDIVNFNVNNLDENSMQIKITDVLGREVSNKKLNDLNENSLEVKMDLSKLKSGAYYYTFTSGSFIKSGKIIKN